MGAKPVIATVGAGLVGSGWTLVFARSGHETRVYDPDPEICAGFVPWAQRSLQSLADAGLIADVDSVLDNIVIVDTLGAALDGACYVQESVFETVESKTEVSLQIDILMGETTIVGSSSSGIPASRFTEGCLNRGRFLIAHPVNPPHLIPVVELVAAPWTNPDAITQTMDLMQTIGQTPVKVNREIDGFILNRLQGALLNEAWALYEDNLASLADIDSTISNGLGLRWAFMGPFETMDLNAPGGITDYAERLGQMYYDMAASRSYRPWSDETVRRAGAERRKSLPSGDLELRRAWRDRMLTQIAAFKKSAGS